MVILIFLIILAVLVLSHELGHFSVAKLFKIRVDEFGFGFPPRIFSFKKGETVYSVNLVPFGGFVKIFGEDPTGEIIRKEDKDFPKSLYHKPRYIQAAVIAAGVLFNLILAWFVLSLGFMIGLPTPTSFGQGIYDVQETKLLVTSVLKDSPAQVAGFRPGDNIVYLASGKDSVQDLKIETVQNFISTNEGKEIYIGVKRSSKKDLLTSIGLGPLDYTAPTQALKVIPTKGVIGDSVGIGISMDTVGILRLSFFKAFYAGILGVTSLFLGTLSGIFNYLLSLLGGESITVSVSGPLGLFGIVGEATSFGLAYLLALTSLISVNLAALNLLPFPALDGGRLLFLAIESIKRKPLNPKLVNAFNMAGFLILLGFMLVVTYNDILTIIKY